MDNVIVRAKQFEASGKKKEHQVLETLIFFS